MICPWGAWAQRSGPGGESVRFARFKLPQRLSYAQCYDSANKSLLPGGYASVAASRTRPAEILTMEGRRAKPELSASGPVGPTCDTSSAPRGWHEPGWPDPAPGPGLVVRAGTRLQEPPSSRCHSVGDKPAASANLNVATP